MLTLYYTLNILLKCFVANFIDFILQNDTSKAVGTSDMFIFKRTLVTLEFMNDFLYIRGH